MANEFVFTSPGVKFREQDLTYVVRSVGLTTLGLVGETLKGPAFQPVPVKDKNDFKNKFGAQSTQKFKNNQLQFILPYVANSYLEESSQLYVTRVLGLSGYDAGTAWALTLSAGVDLSTTGVTSSTVESKSFTGTSYLGVPLYEVGDTGIYFSGFTKISDTEFQGYLHEFTATTITSVGGTVDDKISLITGSSLSEYENMVLAVIRSRARVVDVANAPSITEFYTDEVSISENTTLGGVGDLYGTFKITASSDTESEEYIVSLNPNSSKFLPNVIGSKPKDKNTMIWVEAIYPDLIKKIYHENWGYGVNNNILECNSLQFTDYRTSFKTPETPWVVSQVKGNSVDRLFKFISISDGDSANQEIKISIANIRPDSLEFDVYIRSFNDTDDNPIILESFTKCTLNKQSTNYIAQRIGSSDGVYTLKSNYVMVEMASDDISPEVFPAGFEGYMFNDFSSFNGKTPKILYKTKYESDDKLRKTYLGVSEKGYSVYNSDGLVEVVGEGINQNFFNFNGKQGQVKTKGFHMDVDASGITSNGFEFECGVSKFQTISDVENEQNAYFDISARKFTLVPAGGFDGWDVNRGYRSNTDNYRPYGIYDGVDASVATTKTLTDWQAWYLAINTFANPEEITINLFATPGINWADNTTLVQEAIEMIETQRTDSLYVIDSPDIVKTQIIGEPKIDVEVAKDLVSMLEGTGIDSNYACTYFPWIQIKDVQNNVNVYIPPTGEVVKGIAFTDNTKFPWFAPAGTTRGVTNAIKSKIKLSQEARGVLYEGRINPLVDYADVGTAIFGQKTLQSVQKESALNRINVRRLLLQIKVLISNIAIRLVFEQNDQTVVDQFIQKVTPILDSIKRERGLFEFKIKMDDSNNTPETRDRNELYGEIFLKPTRALEYIGITFTITPTGASFADIG